MNKKLILTLETLEKEYLTLEKELQTETVLKNIRETTVRQKRLRIIGKKVELYQEWKKKSAEITEWEKILKKDSSLQTEGQEEIKKLEKEKKTLENKIIDLFVAPQIQNDKNFIVEIRGAAGGEEANLFASELAEAYWKLAKKKSWNYEILEISSAESGGFSFVSFLVKNPLAYADMRFEAGVHRIQRIPKTESQGRVHTSTATVAVLLEREETEIPISAKELRIETFRSSGAGGQHVNTTDSAIRITHLPTGLVVSCQAGRSQHDNKDKALKVLRARLFQRQEQFSNQKEIDFRKKQVGLGNRSEKIRTYNYPQNRVTDHRIKLTVKNIDKVMSGGFEEFWKVLHTANLTANEKN